MRSGRLDSCKAVALTVKTYHSRNQAAAGQLRFFSGDLRGFKRIRNHAALRQTKKQGTKWMN